MHYSTIRLHALIVLLSKRVNLLQIYKRFGQHNLLFCYILSVHFLNLNLPLLRNKTNTFKAGKLKLKFYKGIAFASLKFSTEIYITIVYIDCLFQ